MAAQQAWIDIQELQYNSERGLDDYINQYEELVNKAGYDVNLAAMFDIF